MPRLEVAHEIDARRLTFTAAEEGQVKPGQAPHRAVEPLTHPQLAARHGDQFRPGGALAAMSGRRSFLGSRLPPPDQAGRDALARAPASAAAVPSIASFSQCLRVVVHRRHMERLRHHRRRSDWFAAFVERQIAGRFTALLDLGGGDLLLKQLAREIGLYRLPRAPRHPPRRPASHRPRSRRPRLSARRRAGRAVRPHRHHPGPQRSPRACPARHPDRLPGHHPGANTRTRRVSAASALWAIFAGDLEDDLRLGGFEAGPEACRLRVSRLARRGERLADAGDMLRPAWNNRTVRAARSPYP